MYLFTSAYPAAKELLQSRFGYRSGITRLIDQCRSDYPSPFWDELAECDYDAELNRLVGWWPAPQNPDHPSDAVEVLFIALEDLPYSFKLRGSTTWSRDPEDWQWWYNDDYSGPQFKSQIMDFAFEQSEIHDQAKPAKNRRRKNAATNSYEVVEMFFSLGYFGFLVRELIRSTGTAKILGNRLSRWFVIGHPDAVYGIIMGRLTRSRWQTYHG